MLQIYSPFSRIIDGAKIWILGKMRFYYLKMIETQIEPFENKYPLLNVAALKHLILQDEPFLAISPRYVNDGHGGGNFKDVNKGVVIVNEEKVKILGSI